LRPTLTPIRAQFNQDQSLFFQLPAEVRNNIYGYVLGDTRITITNEPERGAVTPNSCYCLTEPVLHPGLTQPSLVGLYHHQALPLLLVSRQIYAEACLLPFTLNTFDYRTFSGVKDWSRNMPTQTGAIKTFRIYSTGGQIDPHDTFVTLPYLPGLKRLEIVIMLSHFEKTLRVRGDGIIYFLEDGSCVEPLTTDERREVDAKSATIKAKARELVGNVKIVLLEQMREKSLE
jgi:hypothetical protein